MKAADDGEATDADMLAAVDRWARARRFKPNCLEAWCVDFSTIGIGHTGPLIQRRDSDGKYSEHWNNVDPRTALLWALLVESGATADVGTCPACVARSLPGRKLVTHEWHQASGSSYVIAEQRFGRPRWPQDRAEAVERISRGRKGERYHADWAMHRYKDKRSPHDRARLRARPGRYRVVGSRPCPDCNGSGRDVREAARLLLDVAPRPHTDLVKPAKYSRAKCRGCGYAIATTRGGLIRSHTGPGPGPRCSGSKQRPDTAARDHVDVCATKLQTLGDLLGEWLALWLAGKREGTADMIERRIFADSEGGHTVVRYGYVPRGVRLANDTAADVAGLS